MTTVSERIIKLVAVSMQFSQDRITLSTSFVTDLAADSLSTFGLIGEIESHFKVRLSDEDVENIMTVDDLVKLVERAHSEVPGESQL